MSRLRIGMTAIAVLAAVSCTDTTNPLAGTGQSVSLSFAGRVPGTAGVQSADNILADSMVITSGANTLVISSVELVLRKIELKRQATTMSCDSAPHEDDCAEFETGAVLVSVPLAAGALSAVSVPVDSGTYTKLEFKVHKPGSDSVDNAFKAANPGWPANTSIRVTGRYNGVAFTYITSLDVEQESVLSPPLVVDASGSATNLTLRVDVSTWFKTVGGALIDPASANVGGANEGIVKSNIQNSFHAFEDHNHDGNESNG